MIINGVSQIAGSQLLSWRRGWKCAVVQAFAVGSKDRMVIFSPPQHVRQIFARGQVSNMPIGPVRAALRHAVNQLRTVRARHIAGKGYSFRRKQIRRKRDGCLTLQTYHCIEDALWLESSIVGVKVTLARV